jgi:hypothetical protein
MRKKKKDIKRADEKFKLLRRKLSFIVFKLLLVMNTESVGIFFNLTEP